MKAVALVINPNQNEVSASEIAKIKRALRKFLPVADYKFVTYANDEADNNLENINENEWVVINTSDVNGVVRAWMDHCSMAQFPFSVVLN